MMIGASVYTPHSHFNPPPVYGQIHNYYPHPYYQQSAPHIPQLQQTPFVIPYYEESYAPPVQKYFDPSVLSADWVVNDTQEDVSFFSRNPFNNNNKRVERQNTPSAGTWSSMLHFSDPLTDWRKELAELRKDTTPVPKSVPSLPSLPMAAVSKSMDPTPVSVSALSERNIAVPPLNLVEVVPIPSKQISPRAQEYFDQENVDPNSNSGLCLYGLDTETAPHDPEFKKFLSALKAKEKEGFEAVKKSTESLVSLLPGHLRWKGYMEVAEIAKKENYLKSARLYYRKAIECQPYACQPWLEFAKLEEESGDLEKSQLILQAGLQYCPYNEGLIVRAIRLEERMGSLQGARAVLARLKNLPIEKCWRSVMEGALLEARIGNINLARKIFKYLILNAPLYISVYQEAATLEEKCENYARAMEIAHMGLEINPRYGPLWFTLLRLSEKLAQTGTPDLKEARSIAEQAVAVVPKELRWKVYFEVAQMEERFNNLQCARESYVKSVSQCPKHLLWKVWLAGARTELRSDANSIHVARKLVKRSLQEVPDKKKSQVFLEWSRIEEYAGNVDEARAVLNRAKKEAKHEWKVFLETVLLELRNNNIPAAIREAEDALKIHAGTGRLWSLLIQMNQKEDEKTQLQLFKQALQEVPKSGEVWCEGARIYLMKRDWQQARRFLDFAIHFTPQYGDSFIEYLRLELLEHGRSANFAQLQLSALNAEPNYGNMWLYCKKTPLDSTLEVLRNARDMLKVLTCQSKSKQPIPTQPSLLSLEFTQQYSIKDLSAAERWNAIFGCDHLKA